MAGKITGLNWTTCAVDNSGGSAQNIRNDVRDVQIEMPRAIQDVTGLDKSAYERLHLLSDLTVTLNGIMNVDANASHLVISSFDNQRTVTNTVAGVSLGAEMLITNYDPTRSDSGEFTWTASFVLANGTVPAWT